MSEVIGGIMVIAFCRKCPAVAYTRVFFALIATVLFLVHTDGNAEQKRFYVGLGYGPGIGGSGDLKVGITGETMGVLPYKDSAGDIKLLASNFDWGARNSSSIKFDNSTFVRLGGQVGYVSDGVRFEAEFGYDQFGVSAQRRTHKSRDKDAVFLLIKSMAADMANGHVDQHNKDMLEKTGGRLAGDLKGYFEQYGPTPTICTVALEPYEGTGCGIADEEARKKGTLHRPMCIEGCRCVGKIISGTQPQEKLKVTPELMAKVLSHNRVTAMGPQERYTFAQALAVVAEGAEVLEVSAVRVANGTVNFCFDKAVSSVEGLSGYACGGLGAAFVGIGNWQSVPRFLLKLKLGAGYNITERALVYFGGVYGKVVGSHYSGVETKRLLDDVTPLGRSRETTNASLGIGVLSCEIGFRWMLQ